eukprot:11326943-Alexandrium_andersonii.AAC.1
MEAKLNMLEAEQNESWQQLLVRPEEKLEANKFAWADELDEFEPKRDAKRHKAEDWRLSDGGYKNGRWRGPGWWKKRAERARNFLLLKAEQNKLGA